MILCEGLGHVYKRNTMFSLTNTASQVADNIPILAPTPSQLWLTLPLSPQQSLNSNYSYRQHGGCAKTAFTERGAKCPQNVLNFCLSTTSELQTSKKSCQDLEGASGPCDITSNNVRLMTS